MSKYIDADKLKSILEDNGLVYSNLVALRHIDDLSGEDVAPIIHAYWKHIRDEQAFYNCEIWNYFRCSHCNFKSTANYNYCPKCGAKMDGEK